MNHSIKPDWNRKMNPFREKGLPPLWGALVLVCMLSVSIPPSTYGQSSNQGSITTPQNNAQDVARWEREAQSVTIYRDNWGIAHVYGKTDAQAVFGMEYAQAEDDFNRVETNYINALGLLAQAEGKSEIYRDLRRKLFMDPKVMKTKYAASPEWLKKLMNAFADGLNYYLYKHPEVKPRVIKHFEPWMALAFSEGSIGGDVERVNVGRLTDFYSNSSSPSSSSRRSGRSLPPPEPQGSNGIAIAPSNTLDHHALLLINPHVSFYFRDELHMVSEEGLNAYGAATWGQFFIYQGFNSNTGWMHTSSGVQNISFFLETVTKKDGQYYYKYGDKQLPMKTRQIVVKYKTDDGGMAEKSFTAYYTQHGPIIAKAGDKWESVNLMQRPMRALIQGFKRMKTADYDQFRKTMQLHTNSSNNTIFADSKGNIAYWHSNWIPKRSDKFDWGKPVDGSNPATAFNGLLSLEETPHLHNPANGWLFNVNNWPWSAAGPDSPKREDFPKYVDRGTRESPRGYHALRLLTGKKNWTMASLSTAAYDSYLPPFAKMIPVLLKAYDDTPASNALKTKLAKQITVLRGWDYRWGVSSVATSLSVFWGLDLYRSMYNDPKAKDMSLPEYVAKLATPTQLLQSLEAASGKLATDFGAWQTPWGHINRYQRITSDNKPHFDDSKHSIPIPFTSSRWGSLASFGARPYPNTTKWYGNSGNSFVCLIEFGPKVRAWALKVGGNSGDPNSPHFKDQAANYATGNLRTVYYYKSQLKEHVERKYHPGYLDDLK